MKKILSEGAAVLREHAKEVPTKEITTPKIKKTIARDKKYTKQLKEEGWKVLRFWEYEINKYHERCIKKLS